MPDQVRHYSLRLFNCRVNKGNYSDHLVQPGKADRNLLIPDHFPRYFRKDCPDLIKAAVIFLIKNFFDREKRVPARVFNVRDRLLFFRPGELQYSEVVLNTRQD